MCNEDYRSEDEVPGSLYLVAVDNEADSATACDSRKTAERCRSELVSHGVKPETIKVIPRWLRAAKDFDWVDVGSEIHLGGTRFVKLDVNVEFDTITIEDKGPSQRHEVTTPEELAATDPPDCDQCGVPMKASFWTETTAPVGLMPEYTDDHPAWKCPKCRLIIPRHTIDHVVKEPTNAG